jgi:hypothetical protein
MGKIALCLASFAIASLVQWLLLLTDSSPSPPSATGTGNTGSLRHHGGLLDVVAPKFAAVNDNDRVLNVHVVAHTHGKHSEHACNLRGSIEIRGRQCLAESV